MQFFLSLDDLNDCPCVAASDGPYLESVEKWEKRFIVSKTRIPDASSLFFGHEVFLHFAFEVQRTSRFKFVNRELEGFH
ncbi:hypothetical protein CEXT_627101 [Caerostris extrusa]|uniref:Uncharacterized protein n=1 Tax=Caerostris extrusa TaxID=172846 RepID=A0AAV4XRT9_CAEEX|nr:hypothetical protein CEXT_627101 [Caerostris extrusa]